MYFLYQNLAVDTKIFDFVTLSLTFDLLLKKLNLDHNFWTKSDRAKYYTYLFPVTRPFCWYQYFWPSGLDLDFDLLLQKLELVVAGGISPVRTDPDLVAMAITLAIDLIHIFLSTVGKFDLLSCAQNGKYLHMIWMFHIKHRERRGQLWERGCPEFSIAPSIPFCLARMK